MAAYNGHLAVLQWARAQGCPWDENTCSSAGENGLLAILEWAQVQGCPCDQETLNALEQEKQRLLLQRRAMLEYVRTLNEKSIGL